MRVALFLVLLAGCGPVPAPNAQTRTDSILAGAADTASTAVFLLDLRYDNGHTGICSATLISPRVLITAGHCIDPSKEGATAVIVKGTNKADDSDLHASDFILVTKQARHPNYSGEGPHDLGLLLLETAVVGVTPKPLVRTPPSTWVGQSLRMVGYGRTSVRVADSGTRRSASVTVTTANAEALEFGSAGGTGICSGDSGGAGFFNQARIESLAGVHSYGLSNQCGNGGDVRIDTNLSFIDGFITTNDPATCAADTRCDAGCTPVDPDCVTDGDVCQGPADCATRQCEADPRGYSVCSRTCTKDTDCQREMVCGSGLCRVPSSTTDAGTGVGVKGACATSPGLLGSWFAFAAAFSVLGSASRRRRQARPSTR